MLILDQVIQLVITALVSAGTMQMQRAYFHGTVLSFVLFSRFFFFSTFEDIGNAIREQNRMTSTIQATRRSEIKSVKDSDSAQNSTAIKKTAVATDEARNGDPPSQA